MAQRRTRRTPKKPPCVVPVPPTVTYRVDEVPKRKHHWDRDEPGFVEVAGNLVGKCPSSMDEARAELLLRGGVGFCPANWREPRPERIYVVHHACVYRATATNPAELSYHGFPEIRERLPPLRELRTRLLALAAQEGTESEKQVMKWLDSAT